MKNCYLHLWAHTASRHTTTRVLKMEMFKVSANKKAVRSAQITWRWEPDNEMLMCEYEHWSNVQIQKYFMRKKIFQKVRCFTTMCHSNFYGTCACKVVTEQKRYSTYRVQCVLLVLVCLCHLLCVCHGSVWLCKWEEFSQPLMRSTWHDERRNNVHEK